MRHSLHGCMLWAWVCPSRLRVRNNPWDPTGKPPTQGNVAGPGPPQKQEASQPEAGVPGAGVPCALPHAGVPGRAWGQVCVPPQHKDTPVGSQLGALALTEYPQESGRGRTNPAPRVGCGSRPHSGGVGRPHSGWSGLSPGSDMTQGCPPLPRSREHIQLTPYWLPRTLPPREGLHAWGGGSCWDSVGCGGSGRVSDQGVETQGPSTG